MLAKLRSGCAIIYDCDAVAREETPPDVSSEFHRRARIGAGGFQSIALLWRLLDPRRGWVAFTFFSHKVLRWLCPFFLIGLWRAMHSSWTGRFPLGPRCTARLLRSVTFNAIPAEQLRLPKLIRLMTMFTSMNAALLVGFVRWLGKRQNAGVEADGPGGGSKRSAPMSSAYLLPCILAIALSLVVLAGGGLAATEGMRRALIDGSTYVQ